MNKIYKVMWSKVKGCYVVVSELAKSHGKDKSRSKTRSLHASLALTAFVCAYVGMAVGQPVMAKENVKAYGKNIVADDNELAEYSVLLNPPTAEDKEKESRLSQEYSVPPGMDRDGKKKMGNYSIITGYGANTNSNHVIVIGLSGKALYDSDYSLGIGDTVRLSAATNGIAIGRSASISNSGTAMAIGDGVSSNTSDYSIIMGPSALNITSPESIGIGHAVRLNDAASSIVLGQNAAVTKASDTIVIGHDASAAAGGTDTTADDSVVLGHSAQTDSEESIVIGKNATIKSTTKNFGLNSVVIGGDSFYSDNPYNVGLNLGDGAGSGQGVAVGSKVVTTTQATAVGNDVYALGRSSIAIGSDDIKSYRDKISSYDFENYFKTLYEHIDPTGVKYGYGTQQDKVVYWASDPQDKTQTYNKLQTVYSPTLAQGDGAIAIGSRSLAFNPGSTALGTLAFALAQGSTAVGTQTRSEGVGSIAIGSHTDVFADNSVGTGNKIQILNQGGMAYGYKGYAGGQNSIAIGSNVFSNVKMDLTAQINDSTNTPHYVFSTKEDGTGLLTEGLTQTAKIAGSDEQMNSSQYFSKSGAGYIATLEKIITATKDDPTATVTPGSPAPQVSSVFLPVWQEKNGVAKVIQGEAGKDNAITLGSYSAALGNNAIAVGHGSFALADNNFAIGSFSYANAKNAMAIGLTSRALGVNSLALGVGTSAADSANDSIAIGTGSVNYGSKSSLIGNSSTITEGTTSLLFGSDSAIAGSSNIAVGNAIHVTKRDGNTQKNLAIGNNVFITDGTVSSMALGTDSKIGNGEMDNRNMGISNAIALGVGAQVTSTDGEDENGKNAIAIGNNAQATLFNSIALGTESRTDYTKAELSKTPWAMPGAIATPSANNIGVVSVGAKDHERRIVNVASGAEDTDAVNVAQLRMTTEQLLDEINRRGQDGMSSYMSVQREKGDSAAMDNRVHAVQNYSKYIGLKKQALIYQARQALNGETFNQEALQPLYDKVTEMEKANPNFKTVAKDLADLVVPSSGTTYQDFRDKIYAAFDKDKVYDDEGKIVNEGIVKTLTNVDAATLLQQEKDSNYNNLGAAGADSLAFGYAAKTTEDSANAVAIGKNAKASAANAVALGVNTTSAGESSVAIGNGAAANGASSVALGKSAAANGANTVALGNGAVADLSNEQGLTFGGSYATLTGAVQTPTGGAVLSVGAPSNTRRITNVAAGAADTDAVNVAQLRDLAANKLYLEDGSKQFTKGVSLGDTSSNADHRLSLKITGSSASDAAITTAVNSDKDGVVIDLTDAAKKDLANAGAGVNALKDAIGLPKDSSSDSPAAQAAGNNVSGPAATDGLSKSPLITQMQAVRDGNAGLVVYTNNKGERLAKVGDKYYSTKGFKQAKDGKWYPEAQVQADGTTVKNATAHNFSGDAVVNNSDIRATIVNPDGTTTAPTPLANIASGLGLANVNGASSTAIAPEDARAAVAGTNKDGKGGLLTMKGADLTRGANLGDLQAVAQAGLSFTGNENGKSVQRALGTSLGIKGADANTNAAQFSDANVMTTVDTANNALRINIAKTPQFEGVKLQAADDGSKPVSITPGKDGHTVTLAGPEDPSNKNSTDVELKGLKNGGADNSAATVGQVKELIKEVKPASGSGAKGLTFNTNEVVQADHVAKTTAQADGSTVTIQGATNAQYDGSKYSTDNLTTFVDTTTSETPVIRIAMKDTPKLKGVDLNNGQPDAKTVSLTPDKDGNLALSNDNAPDKKVVLTGLKDGDSDDSAVTKKALDGVKTTAEAAKTAAQNAKDGLDALNGAVGLPGADGNVADSPIGIAGKNGKTGPAGKDGLNGTALATQAQALRDGTAGVVVYTTKDGDRVAKVGDKYYKVDGLKQAKDGKWYPAGQVHEDGSVEKSAVAHNFVDGEVVPATNIRASLVNPDGTTTAPTPLANIASGLGLDNVTGAESTAITGDAASKAVAGASKDGKGGLLTMKGADLTRGANLGDLQAVAQAGLNFTGNENGKSVQRALGTSLGIKGADTNTNASQFSDANVMTTVDTTNNALRINIAKTPQFEGVKLQSADSGSKPVSITPDAAGHTVTLAGPVDPSNKNSTDVELKGLKNGGADNSAATVGQVKELIKEVKPASGSGAKGLTFNTNNVLQANNVANTTKQADGSTVTIQGATGAQYDGSKYSTDNLTTFVDTTTSETPVIRIAMKDTPKLKGVDLNNGQPDAKTVSLTPNKDGNLALSNDNTPDNKVVLTGLKDGDTPDSAVTKKALDGVKTTAETAKDAAEKAKNGLDALNGAVGLPGADGNVADSPIGIAGKNGKTGPAGKDGLNGTALVTQAQALRDGTAGVVVYTTKDGDRVAKVGDKYYKVDGLKQAKDGKWYPAGQVHEDGSVEKSAVAHNFVDGEVVPPTNIRASLVNPDGTTTAPTPLANIASGLGLDNVTGAESTAITGDAASKAVAGASKDGKGGLLTMKGADLTRGANLGDLQAVAQAGLSFTGNENGKSVQRALGTSLGIKGADTNTNAAQFSDANVMTTVDTANNALRINIAKTPQFEGVKLQAAGDGSKPVSITPNKDGNLALSNDNAPDNKVVLTGLKDGDSDDSAVTKKALDGVKTTAEAAKTAAQNAKDGLDALNSAVGLPGAAGGDGAIGIAGKNGETGPAGKDGLNGTALATQAQALRDGTAGNVVYTTKDGDRVSKVGDKYYKTEGLKQAKDGKWYPAEKVNKDGSVVKDATPHSFQDSEAVKPEDLRASLINPDGTTKTPTALGNVGSALELPGKYTSEQSSNTPANPAAITADAAQKAVAGNGKDGKDGLLTKSGTELNRATTLGDLQAVAQAGLDFTGNEAGKTVHRPLGTSLAIKGDDANTEAAKFSATNIMTTVDPDNNVLRINFAKTPQFEGVKLQAPGQSSKTITLTPSEAGDEITLAGGASGVVLKGLKESNDKTAAATVGQLEDKISQISRPTGSTTVRAAEGLTFKTNKTQGAESDQNLIKQADGSTVIIEGAKGSNFDSTTYSSDNLTVYADKSDTSNPVVRVAMKDTPKLKGLELNNGAEQAKTVTVTPDKDGNVTLSNGESPDSNVVLSGLKDGNTDDSAVTKKALDGVKTTAETAKSDAEEAKTAAQNAKNGLDALNSAVGLPGAAGQDGAIGIAGKNGKTGPAGKDGLNGTALATQAQALRDGTAGNVVYTTKNGDRVFKVGDNYYNVENLKQAKDGKWYPKDQVNDDGTTKPEAKAQDFTQLSPVATKDIIMSAVNPDGTATTPTALGNVGSALELPGKYTEAESANSAVNPAAITADAAQKAVAGPGKDGKGGLLTQAGPGLNRATTLGDLQAVAQAGLDFTGNEADKTVHRALGTSLAIKGDDGNTEAANFSAANIMTTVDTTNNVVRINFAKTPKFEGVKLQSPSDGSQPISITPDAAGHTVTLAGPQDPSNKNSTDVELKGLKNGGADNSAATVGQVKDLIKDLRPTSTATPAKGLTFNTNEVATAEHVAKTTAQADGSTVRIQGASDAQYDASKYSTDNISTFVDTTTSDSPVIRIAMKNTPKVKGLELNNGEPQAKTVTVTPDQDGNVKLANGEGADNKVVLTGLKDGTTDDSAVTKKALDGVQSTAETAKNTAETAKNLAENAKNGLDALNSAVGLPGAAGQDGAIGIAGKNGATGPAGKDGLNGTALATQAQALRDGTAGNVVYTTKEGDRVFKVGDNYYNVDNLKQAKDGKWYPKDQVKDDGTTKPGAKAQDFDQLSPVATKDIIMSAVNPDGTTKTPTALGNVASALELPGKYTDAQASNTPANPVAITTDAAQKAIAGEAKDGKGGLLTKSGADLNRATTLGDLQAVAQAGLDFTGNETGKTVHRTLGTSLAIKGDDKNTDAAKFSAANIMTTVDTDNNVVRINFATTPQFEGVKLQAPGQTSKPISLTPNAAGDEIVLGGGATGKDNVVLSGLKPSEDRTAAATVGQLEDKISQLNRPSGGTVSAAQGLTFKTNTTASASSGQNLVKQADGSTVSIEGAANSNFDATKYSSDNLAVYADKSDTSNPVIRVAMKDTPKLKGLELNNGAQAAKTVTVTPDKDGNVQLSNGESPDNKVVLSGLKDGSTPDSAVTKKALDEVKSTADTAKNTAETAKNTAETAKNTAETAKNTAETAKDTAETAKNMAETAKNTAESAKDGVDALKSAVGLPGADGGPGAIGIAGENGKTGPAGKDGLNGTALATQAQALRDGTAGNVVYTTKEGDRVFKVGDKYYKVDNLKQAKDGKWYPADKVKTDGSVESGATAHDFSTDHEVAPADIRASLVNPDGTATKPTALGNVASALELPGTYASTDASHNVANPAAITADAAQKAIAGDAKDGNGGLLTKTGADLNRATTLGDLQAVAQAGLTFTSNEASKDIHRPLGTSLGIKGADGNTDGTKFSATNIMTTLDTAENVVRINFAKTPQFEGVKLQAPGQDSKTISITPDATGHTVTLAGPADASNQGKTDVELKGLKNGSADNSAATVGQVKDLIKDLRPTSTATPAKGLTFNTNTVKAGDGLNTVKQVDGSTVTIQGSSTAQYDASKYSTDNISTYVDNSKADSPVIRIAMKDTPEVKGLALNNGADQAKTVTVTPDKDGNVQLSNGESPDNKVVLSGLKDGTTDDSAVTKKALDGVKSTAETAKNTAETAKDTAETAKNMAESAKNGLDALNSAVGLPGADGGPGAIGIAGANGKTGPAGKDGLNGTALATQAQALRDGTAGNVVYTTKEGDRVFKVGDKYYKTDGLKQAKDGKWYPAEKVQTDGSVTPGATAHDFTSDHEVAPADIRASLINPDGTATTPTALGNVASALELPGKYTEDQSSNTPANPAAITADAAQKAVAGNSKDGNGGLLTKAGADLNRATTLGDLQAVAQAGLDFTGNESNKTVHRPLGTSLAIKGDDANTDAAKFSATNVMTTVDTDNNVVRINFAKTPQFDAVKLGADNKAISLTPSAAGDKITVAGPAGTDGKTDVVLSGLKGDSTDLSSAVTYGQLQSAIANLRPSDEDLATARDLAALKDAVGLPGTTGESGAIGEAGKNGKTGPAGKDGLNGMALATQAQALRDGTAGNVVYTTKEGDRVFKVGDKYYKVDNLKQAKDGKWYPADKVKADGSVVPNAVAHDFTQDHDVAPADIRASLINADGTTTAPTTLGNVASALDLPGKYADSQATNSPANPAAITADAAQKAIAGDSKDGNGGLLTKSGADLNRATTLGDLQAVAQAGLTFTSNEANKDIHRPLGTTLGIKGDDANVDASKFSDANVMTTVDAINNVIRINIAKAPVFDSVQFGTAGPSLVVNKEGKLSIKQGDQVAPIATEASSGFYVNTDHGKFFLGMGDTLNLSNLGDSNVTVSAVKNGESTPTSGSTGGVPSESAPKTESTGNVPSATIPAAAQGGGTTGNVSGATIPAAGQGGSTSGAALSPAGQGNSYKVGVQMNPNPVYDSVSVTGKVTKDNNLVPKKYVDEQLGKVVSQANNIISNLGEQMRDTRNQASAGTASAMAAAGLPTVINADSRHVVSIGFGSYDNQTAMAVGMSGTNRKRDRIYKVTGTVDSAGKYGVSAGLSFAVGGKDHYRPGRNTYDAGFSERLDKLEAEAKKVDTQAKTIDKLTKENADLKSEVETLKQLVYKQLNMKAQEQQAPKKDQDTHTSESTDSQSNK